ncbi:MAG: hypothetical protein K0Q87_3385, partial [Neobacillus sp.]|nr:hypothetical protein [Neobacillus sp.]
EIVAMEIIASILAESKAEMQVEH